MDTFARSLTQAKDRLTKAGLALSRVQTHLDGGDRDGAYRAAFSYALECEKLVFQARNLPALTGYPAAVPCMRRQVRAMSGIEMGWKLEGWFAIRLPALLPKKGKGTVDYLRAGLCYALADYFACHPRLVIDPCTLVIRHVYAFERPERQYRDHDNIEVNAVIDAAARYLLVDDGPVHCGLYQCSQPGELNCTEVYIVPDGGFPRWLEWASLGGKLIF